MVLAIDSGENKRSVVHPKLQRTSERDLHAPADVPGIIRFAASTVAELHVKADAKAWYRRFDQDWPSIWDPTGKIAARLGLGSAHGGFPTTFFLNRRHEIVAVVAGAGTISQFERAYRKTLRST